MGLKYGVYANIPQTDNVTTKCIENLSNKKIKNESVKRSAT